MHGMCAVWDLNGDGGSAEQGKGNYETHSEHRFIQPAGTLFASKKKAFSFCFGRGPLKPCLFPLVSQLLTRRVITEHSL